MQRSRQAVPRISQRLLPFSASLRQRDRHPSTEMGRSPFFRGTALGSLRPTSKRRVRRLMRENGLAAATRSGSPRGPRSYKIGGAPRGQRTQRCRLDAHRGLLAAVRPGDALSDKTPRARVFERLSADSARKTGDPRCAQRANEGPDRRLYGQEGTDCSACGSQRLASRRDCFHSVRQSPMAEPPPIDLDGSTPLFRGTRSPRWGRQRATAWERTAR